MEAGVGIEPAYTALQNAGRKDQDKPAWSIPVFPGVPPSSTSGWIMLDWHWPVT